MKIYLSIIFLLLRASVFATNLKIERIEGLDFKKNTKTVLEITKEYNVFMFFSASCPCSQSYFDYLNELAMKFPKIGFVGFHSSKSINLNVAVEYFSTKKISFPIFDDSKLIYADLFKALKTPHVFVTDKNGEIVYHGAVADSRNLKMAKNFYLIEALNDINNDIKPRVSFARALGCYIAR